MMDRRYQIGNMEASTLLPGRQTTIVPRASIVASMATRSGLHKGPAPYLYIQEYQDIVGLSDEELGDRIGVARETIFRWKAEQNRLNPSKMAQLANALEIEPEDLYRKPSRRSVDALIKDAPDEIAHMLFDIASRMTKGNK